VRSACQQVGVRLEVIAIDDGSSDNTLLLLRKLEKRFQNLRVISQGENGGQSSARNAGIRSARGRWLAFLDSDDFYSSNEALAGALASAQDGTVDVVLVGALKVKGYRRVPIIPKELSATTITTASLWQLIVARRYLQRAAIRFDESLPQREDKPFSLQVLTGTKSIVIHPEPTVVKVSRGGSTMLSTVDKVQISYRIRHMESIVETIEKNSLDQDIQRALTTLYLEATLSSYWAGALVENMRGGSRHGTALARSYLSALHSVTRGTVSLCVSNTTLGEGRRSSRLDILRLVAELGRLDYFEILLRGKELKQRELRNLVEESLFPWAQPATTTYLQHCGSSSRYLPETKTVAPALAAVTERVVVHLGFPKTGTSALQAWMEENRFALLEEGIWYPIIGSSRGTGMREDRSAGHTALLRLLGNKVTKNRAIDSLAAEIASLKEPVHTVFLSSEMFLSPLLWRNPGKGDKSHPIRAIRSSIPLEVVDVMVVARPPIEWATKYYKEIISNPFNSYSPAFLEFVRLLKKSKLTDIEIVGRLLKSVFLPRKVWLSAYTEVLQEGGIVSWVLNRIGVKSKDLVVSQSFDINPSLADAQAFILGESKRWKTKLAEREMVFRKVLESEELKNSSYQLVSEEELEKARRILSHDVELFSRHFPSPTLVRAEAGACSLEPEFGTFINNPNIKPRVPFFYSHLGIVRILRDARGLKNLALSRGTSLMEQDWVRKAKSSLLHAALRWSHSFTIEIANRQIAKGAWDFRGFNPDATKKHAD
jgi:hypothetical protein